MKRIHCSVKLFKYGSVVWIYAHVRSPIFNFAFGGSSHLFDAGPVTLLALSPTASLSLPCKAGSFSLKILQSFAFGVECLLTRLRCSSLYRLISKDALHTPIPPQHFRRRKCDSIDERGLILAFCSSSDVALVLSY